MSKQPAVNILASRCDGTLYTGITSDLIQRVWQHREHLAKGVTDRHHVIQLVWYELDETMESAIQREKRIKAWKRQWKLELIEAKNHYWHDLWNAITGQSEGTGFLLSQE